MQVRDELSGEVFDAEEVRWSATLPRDNWMSDAVARDRMFTHRMTDGHYPWARSTDDGEHRWLPVQVLAT